MSPRLFVNDALWRCLCPGFPHNASILVLARLGADAALRSPPQRHDTSRCSRRQLRAYNTIQKSTDSFVSRQESQAPSFNLSQQPTNPSLRTQRGKPSLVHLTTKHLYETLRIEGAKGHYDEVMKINSILIKDRKQQPNKEMYTAILHSFVSATNGTAGKVRKVLEEMGFWGEIDESLGALGKIELDARGCECVLEALAVHPDYLLRAEILEYMKARWFTLSDRGHHFVTAGLLRERNFEQALDMLEDMIKKKIRVENWLFDKVMWMFLEFGEVEEAFYVLSLRTDAAGGTSAVEMSTALWGALLDAATQKQLHDATNLLWTTRVQPGHLNPPTNTCMNALAVASRAGNVPLATDVFRLLTARNTTFTTHHYEHLIACYLAADDLTAALSILLIMVSANVRVDAGTCHAIYWYLYASPSRPMQAFTLLQDFEASGRKVPTAAVNVCIQASVAHKNFSEAVEIYKALRSVAHAGPNTATFNILFAGCGAERKKEVAMLLVEEMIAMGVQPDRLTYDRLILVCLGVGDLDDALLYYEEMKNAGTGDASKAADSPTTKKVMGMRPRRATWATLVTKCVEMNDERGVAVYRDLVQEGGYVHKEIGRALREKFVEAGDVVPREGWVDGPGNGNGNGDGDINGEAWANEVEGANAGTDGSRDKSEEQTVSTEAKRH